MQPKVVLILVNSAGGQFIQPALDFSEKGWRAVVETNVNGTFNMVQSAARAWHAANCTGSIVNVVLSPRGMHQMAHSCTARTGVIAFSEAVAVEWAPLGIRINRIAPGTIASDHFTLKEQELCANSNPMRTTGTPWEVAEACLFIGGPASRFTTGQTLHVNCGSDLWGESWPVGKPESLIAASHAWDDAGADMSNAREVAAARFQRNTPT